MMSGIRGKDTRPEMTVRRGLHAMGFRYRLHAPDLPGRPDLVFPSLNAVVLVNGCFWHGHDCHLFKWPTSRADFWRQKIGRTRERDREARGELDAGGWRVLTIWECALKGRTRLRTADLLELVVEWLRSGSSSGEIQGHTE